VLFLQKRELRSLWGAISTKKIYKKKELRSLWGAISTKKEAEVFMGCYFYKKGS
jgi:serine/threonine-protein kinase RIO1